MSSNYVALVEQRMSQRIAITKDNFQETVEAILPFFKIKEYSSYFISKMIPFWNPMCDVYATHGQSCALHLNSCLNFKMLHSPIFYVSDNVESLVEFLNQRYLLTYENVRTVVRDKELYRYVFEGEPITYKGYLPLLHEILHKVKKMPDFSFVNGKWSEVSPIIWE